MDIGGTTVGWGREAVRGQDSVLRVSPPCGASNGWELPGCVVLGSQEAPAQLPGVMATRSPAAGCPRDHGADPPPSSRAVLLRPRRATPGTPEGHHGQETGLQEPLCSPCRVPLFSVSALHSLAQVWEPEVSFQPELSTCLTCATTQQPLWGSSCPRLHLLCLQSCRLRTWARRG